MNQDAKTDLYLEKCANALRKHIPFKVEWELTHRCNEVCRHCYFDEHQSPEELALAEITDILDQLAAQGCLFVTFTGGEPLLRSDFFDIAEYARKKEFVLRLLTNGTLVTSQVAARLAALHFQTVEISIYAMDPDLHDSITGIPGSHARSVNALRLLHARGVKVIVKSPIMRDTLKELGPLREFANTLLGGIVYDTRLVPSVENSGRPLAFSLGEDELVGFFNEHLDGWELRDLAPDSHLCNAGRDSACIDPYGRVFPCVQLRLEAGSLRESSFSEIWTNSTILNRIRSVRFTDLVDCPECSYRFYCSFCMGIAQRMCESYLRGPSVLCQEARARQRAYSAKKLVRE